MLVHDFLRRSAERTPDAVAVIEPTARATYAEVNRLANRAGNALVAAGVKRGDRVVLAIDDGIESLACYFGAMKAGAVAVPLPHGPHNDRFARAVEDCSPAAAIVNPSTAGDPPVAAVLGRIPAVFVTKPVPGSARPALDVAFPGWSAALDAASDAEPQVRMIDLDLAAIIYTSGSTGAPRGAMLSHLNIRSNTNSIVEYLHLTSADRVMCVLPFYYVYGLSLVHTHIAVGGSVIVDMRFAFPNVVLKSMQEHRATGFAGVPSTFALLMHRSNLTKMEFPHLRYVTQAGGGMPPARIREWLDKGPKAAFYVMYGATEASARLTYLEPADLQRKLGSIGRGIPNVEILVVNDEGDLARQGEVGELVARGSNISSGYWNNAEETAERFGPLGYRTGDLGYADAEGFLYLVGRKHDMIKVGAHRVGAKEIEDVLNEHPAVSEAAVVPVQHEILGEAPLAFIATRQNVAPDISDILAFCRSRLQAHKVPVDFVTLPSIPKSGIGKIDKLSLRQMAAEHREKSDPRGRAAGTGGAS
jgi:acyl-CoA synthetase (AMP-forming)/AMP-acid ligase II